MATISSFTPGDLVVSIVGDGDGSGNYGDNQATPITLQEFSLNGTATATSVGNFVLPQTASKNTGGTAESAISGEYGSSSEGSLQLAANGQSLVIAGYGVNAATFNSGGIAVYGTTALAQTTSLAGGQYTVVPRVVADISANGTVDTSTSLTNIYNLNNPRSVATTDGSTFYLSGQGNKDATQGVFSAGDGATQPTAINTSIDTRTAELYNGTLYVSQDSSQVKNTGNISSYAANGTATPLPGITGKITLAAGTGNNINGSTGTVDLSPENFFFANQSTLYIADSGNAKGGTLGDGGLQKWTLGTNGSWSLDYTLSSGLNLVNHNTADPGSGGQATTGLIGLAGAVNANGTVSLYATNATIGDLNQTYLYGVTDTLAATAPATATTESFTQLAAAAPDTNIRGVAFAPVCFVTSTAIRTARGDVAVEALAVGDLAVTASGGLCQIRWIGSRTLTCGGAMDIWPVRVRAGSFGADMPQRDLWLSPGHPVLVGADEDGAGGVLVPIMCLINGTSIARVAVDSVTYWHVELEGAHDILLAEGLPAESFLDYGNRPWFGADAEAHALANPDFIQPGLDARCRPVAVGGPLVEAERRRLDALVATQLYAQCRWPAADEMYFGL